MSYTLISPCRNEAQYLRVTLDTVLAQSVPPVRWVIVDDGSTDETPAILTDYAARHPIIHVVPKPDRGHRSVGAGVVEAFNAGLAHVDLSATPFLCKLDLDLELPPRYFEILLARMAETPRLGSASGQPYNRREGKLVSERRATDMAVGMTKFYRTACFEDIGGFVSLIMWDAIDVHRQRQRGWISRAFDDEALRFVHLRPMGSSQNGVLTGRRRHGMGQYVMGSDLAYFMASCVFRALEPPYALGGAHMFAGYVAAALRGEPQLPDPALRRFIRRYQRRALLKGRNRATAEVEAAGAAIWQGRLPGSGI